MNWPGIALWCANGEINTQARNGGLYTCTNPENASALHYCSFGRAYSIEDGQGNTVPGGDKATCQYAPGELK